MGTDMGIEMRNKNETNNSKNVTNIEFGSDDDANPKSNDNEHLTDTILEVYNDISISSEGDGSSSEDGLSVASLQYFYRDCESFMRQPSHARYISDEVIKDVLFDSDLDLDDDAKKKERFCFVKKVLVGGFFFVAILVVLIAKRSHWDLGTNAREVDENIVLNTKEP